MYSTGRCHPAHLEGGGFTTSSTSSRVGTEVEGFQGLGFHPGGNPEAQVKSISHRCYLFKVAFVWDLTKETIHLPLGCLQGGRGLGFHPQNPVPAVEGGNSGANTKREA